MTDAARFRSFIAHCTGLAGRASDDGPCMSASRDRCDRSTHLG